MALADIPRVNRYLTVRLDHFHLSGKAGRWPLRSCPQPCKTSPRAQ